MKQLENYVNGGGQNLLNSSVSGQASLAYILRAKNHAKYGLFCCQKMF